MPQHLMCVLAIFERIYIIRGIKPILSTVVEHPTAPALIAADGRRNPNDKTMWRITGGTQYWLHDHREPKRPRRS